MLQFHKHFPGSRNVRIPHNPVNGIYGAGRYPGCQKRFHHIVNRLFTSPCFNYGLQLCMVLYTFDIVTKLLSFQFRELKHSLEQSVKFIIAARDDDHAVRCFKGIVGIDCLIPVADTVRNPASAQINHIDDLQ